MGKRPLYRVGGGPANILSVKDFLDRHPAQTAFTLLCQRKVGHALGWGVNSRGGVHYLQVYVNKSPTIATVVPGQAMGGVRLTKDATRNVRPFLKRNGWTRDGETWYPASYVCKHCPFRLTCVTSRSL